MSQRVRTPSDMSRLIQQIQLKKSNIDQARDKGLAPDVSTDTSTESLSNSSLFKTKLGERLSDSSRYFFSPRTSRQILFSEIDSTKKSGDQASSQIQGSEVKALESPLTRSLNRPSSFKPDFKRKFQGLISERSSRTRSKLRSSSYGVSIRIGLVPIYIMTCALISLIVILINHLMTSMS